MENVTFVSNSHQRPAADNLQKLKSLLTNTGDAANLLI